MSSTVSKYNKHKNILEDNTFLFNKDCELLAVSWLSHLEILYYYCSSAGQILSPSISVKSM